MFKSQLGLVALCAVLLTTACDPVYPDPDHSSQNVLDWAGRYSGVLPCASCMGLKTELTLEQDGTYQLTETYLGKSKPLHSKGTFRWSPDGGSITLQNDQDKRRFKVGEGRLWQLDPAGRVISGPLADQMILTQQ